MRILHLTESTGWSGGTIQLCHLAKALAQKNHTVCVVCPPQGELYRRLEGSGVLRSALAIRQDYDLPSAWRFSKILGLFRPDIVHTHHPQAHAVALLAGLKVAIPRLVVSRRVSFRWKPWNPFSRLKYKNSRIRMYAVVSDDIRRLLVEAGIAAERIRVIHSGVDTERFAPRPPDEKTRSALGLPRDAAVVGNLNHFSWWKGQIIFLEAARRLLDKKIRAHFLLAGRDTAGPELQEKVRELGLAAHVTLAGFRTDMPEILSLLSVVAVTSLAGEGFSGVLREAMCMGIPAAATTVGGNGELIEDGVSGLLVPPGDAAALAGALERMLADPAFASGCAQNARTRVRDNFSIESMVDKTEALYQSILFQSTPDR